MSYDVKNDDMSYWAHGPCAHQVSLRYLEKWAKYDHCLTTTTTTTSIIIIIAKMKPHKNKIPFPYRGNGITRGTVPRGTVDPIPNGLSLWPRTMFRQVTPSHDHCSAPPLYRHVWDNCQTGIIARVALSRGWCWGPSSDVVNFPNYVTIHLAWTPR